MKQIALITLFLATIAIGIGERASPSLGKKSLQSLPRTGPTNTAFHVKLYGSEMTTEDTSYGSAQLFDYSLNGGTPQIFGTSCFPMYPGFSFDGTNDYIFAEETLQTTLDGSFTISTWCKTTDGQFTDYQVIVGAIHDTTPLEDTVQLTIQTTGKVRFAYESNDDAAYAEGNAATFADGQSPWVHIVGVATADTSLVIYIDGALLTLGAGAAAGDASGITFADYVTDCGMRIGALNSDNTPDGTHSHFYGVIGETIIYNTALDAVEVKNIYETTRWRYSK